ncbi:hypothetical protein F400_gp045 [Bacillus phage BCD7]|uniref:Uncharacterized protein n=1 Tax=Bacillus phage BCD7 TaxID=1136534 RepID=J9PUC9_9CAUD|nr:hypothetical protein F400_gp045 [Bacillus phage BCD7]AEZ50492.1 hypothetical protein BCD7_0045 [Bacillus phage BCD7]
MKKGERKRGFNQFSKHLRDSPSKAKHVANCQSCVFFNDDDECENTSVTEWDLVKEENRTYCVFWQGYAYDNGRKKKDSF